MTIALSGKYTNNIYKEKKTNSENHLVGHLWLTVERN